MSKSVFSPDVLLIDANSIGYATMYQPALARLAFKGKSTSALHGLPASLFKVMRLYPDATPIVLWDGRAQWRYDIYPEYKSERFITPEKKAIRDSYKEQLAHLQQLICAMGLPQLAHRDTEADDLAGVIARNCDPDMNVLLVTTDSDWMQVLAHNVQMFNNRTDATISMEDIHTSTVTGVTIDC